MKDETYPYRYDNCKDCVARCPHAGKDRKFVYHGFKSCKIVKETPRLDRSSWEPCDDCKEISYWDEKCDNCKYDDFFAHQEPCASCESKSKWEPCYSFCPTCGRPLTDAAWDMLEKRLEGAK